MQRVTVGNGTWIIQETANFIWVSLTADFICMVRNGDAGESIRTQTTIRDGTGCGSGWTRILPVLQR